MNPARSLEDAGPTFVVTSIKDGEQEGTLRWAVRKANVRAAANREPAVIDLCQIRDTILLEKPLPIIRANVTLLGVVSETVISGDGKFRCLAVDEKTASICIEGVTLKDGLAQGTHGAGSAGGSSGMGGGLFINAADKVRLRNVRFENNHALGGEGGILSPFQVALEEHEQTLSSAEDADTETQYASESALSQSNWEGQNRQGNQPPTTYGEDDTAPQETAGNRDANWGEYDDDDDVDSGNLSKANRGSVSHVTGNAVGGIGAIAFGGGGGFGGWANGGNGGNGGNGVQAGHGGDGGDGGEAHFGTFNSAVSELGLATEFLDDGDQIELLSNVNRGSLAGVKGKTSGGIGVMAFAGGGGFGGFANGGNGGNGGNGSSEENEGNQDSSSLFGVGGNGGGGGSGGKGSFCDFTGSNSGPGDTPVVEMAAELGSSLHVSERGSLGHQNGSSRSGIASIGFAGGGGFGGFANGANGGNGCNAMDSSNTVESPAEQGSQRGRGGDGGNGGNGGFGAGGGGGAPGGPGGVVFRMSGDLESYEAGQEASKSRTREGCPGSPGRGGWGAGDGGINFGGSGGGFGGAVFIRTGHLVVETCSFEHNVAMGGRKTSPGLGKGGAIFAVTKELVPLAGVAEAPIVEFIGSNDMKGNESSDPGSNETDNNDIFAEFSIIFDNEQNKMPIKQLQKDMEAVSKDVNWLAQRAEKIAKESDELETANPAKLKKDVETVTTDLKRLVKEVERISREINMLEKRRTDPKVNMKSSRTPASEIILTIIKGSRKGIDISALAGKTGFEEKQIYGIIYRLKKSGKIKSPKRGIYLKP